MRPLFAEEARPPQAVTAAAPVRFVETAHACFEKAAGAAGGSDSAPS